MMNDWSTKPKVSLVHYNITALQQGGTTTAKKETLKRIGHYNFTEDERDNSKNIFITPLHPYN